MTWWGSKGRKAEMRCGLCVQKGCAGLSLWLEGWPLCTWTPVLQKQVYRTWCISMLELIPGYVYTYGVTLLIATIAYPSQVFVFAPALKDVWSCFKVLGPLNLLVIAVYYNYYLCVTTDPGQVPANWVCPSLSDISIYRINKWTTKRKLLTVLGLWIAIA